MVRASRDQLPNVKAVVEAAPRMVAVERWEHLNALGAIRLFAGNIIL